MASGARSENATSQRNIIFVDTEDVLDQDGVLIPVAKNSRTNKYGYDIVKLRKNVCLYRGGIRASPDVPAFFGPLPTALTYSRGNDTTVYGYVIKKEPRLFVLSYRNLIKLFDEDTRLTPVEKVALDNYLVVSETAPPYVVPVAFLFPEDLPSPDRPNGMILNRRILNLICRLGYDGWVVRPRTLIQRNLDTAYKQATGKDRFEFNMYRGEITLCSWGDFAQEIKIEFDD
jgi:hypothetical protein